MKKIEILEYLSDIRDMYSSYHSQKETGAWAAVGLLPLLLLQAVNALGNIRELSCVYKIGVTLWILVISYFVWKYVKAQLKVKKRASQYVSACLLLEIEILPIPENHFKPETFSMEPGHSNKMQSERVLPAFLRDKADQIEREVKGEVGFTLDMVRYSLIILSALFAVARIWGSV